MPYPDGTTEEEAEIFDTEDGANEHGMYACSCYSEGAEILNLSNSGDWPLDNEDVDFCIVEIEDRI